MAWRPAEKLPNSARCAACAAAERLAAEEEPAGSAGQAAEKPAGDMSQAAEDPDGGAGQAGGADQAGGAGRGAGAGHAVGLLAEARPARRPACPSRSGGSVRDARSARDAMVATARDPTGARPAECAAVDPSWVSE